MFILKGIGTSNFIGVGRVRKINNKFDLRKMKGGEIAVLSKASRDMLSCLQKAGGVITDYGGITSHVAIVLREVKVPCIVGTEVATEKLKEGSIVTIDGKTGNVYDGFMELEQENDVNTIYQPATMVKVNLNIPEIAWNVASIADGVGSIRIENLVIRTRKHPQKLLNKGKLVGTLSSGVKIIAEAFYPKPVWFRTFDIPSDELRTLNGAYEIEEPNPLLGLRGIQRDIKNEEMFRAEIESVIRLLDQGYDNIGIKVPFLRDLSEYQFMKMIMREMGLRPHKDISMGVALETPSSFLLVDEIVAEKVDFFTLGLSDLTMCSLAVDRRGVKVAKNFDLMHPALWKFLKIALNKSLTQDIETCICGYAASNPHIVTELIGMGITSISTNPDQIIKMRKVVEKTENAIINRKFRF
jgi:pyruvate,water dikinase